MSTHDDLPAGTTGTARAVALGHKGVVLKVMLATPPRFIPPRTLAHVHVCINQAGPLQNARQGRDDLALPLALRKSYFGRYSALGCGYHVAENVFEEFWRQVSLKGLDDSVDEGDSGKVPAAISSENDRLR